jgi:hypothetical protein
LRLAENWSPGREPRTPPILSEWQPSRKGWQSDDAPANSEARSVSEKAIPHQDRLL